MTAGKRLGARVALSLFCFCGIILFVSAQTAQQSKNQPAAFVLPPAFSKPAPATPEELRQIEAHVQKVIAKVMPAIVNLRVGPGQGSGVIIREDGLILTAGHVSGVPNKSATVVFPNGKRLNGKTLGQNTGIDSGMIKIVEAGKYPFLQMGKSADLKRGQWVLAIGHPGGFRPNRTPVVRLGRILEVTRTYIQTDCTLVGGDSGGPLFDMQGRVIGIHSRIGATHITENVHVPIDTYHETFTRLEKGDSWGGPLGSVAVVRPAGGKEVYNKKDSLDKNDPTMTAPTDKEKGTPKADALKSFYKTYRFRMKAGSTYTIDMIANNKSPKKQRRPAADILDPYLRLESPEGKMVADDDDGAGNMNARIVYKALKDGDYRIIASSFQGEETGSFTLKIFEADFRDAIVAGSVDLLRAIRLPAPHVAQLLEKSKQAKLALHVNAVLLDGKGNPQANKEIVFNWEKGSQKLKSDNQGIVRWPLVLDKTRKLTLQVPPGIRAMVALTDPDGHSLPIGAGKDDPSLEKIKSAGGKIVQTFDGSLNKTDPFDFERDKCVRHIHSFKMQKGKTYTIDLASEDFDAFLRLEDADGNKLAEDDDGAGFANSRIVHTPAADGAFRIVVTTCYGGEKGSYRVTIRETNAKPTETKKDQKK